MSALHPTIARALAPFAPPARQDDTEAKQRALAHYKAMLADFDFQAEFSDDYRATKRARDLLPVMLELQRHVDPSGAIWLAAMPKERDGSPLHGAPLPEVVR